MEQWQTQNLTNEQQRRNVVEKTWLNYYNNMLLAQGLISASMHGKMKVHIRTRKSDTHK